TTLGRQVADGFFNSESRLRLALASLAAINGCQQVDDKPARDILLSTLTTLLRRNINLTESHVGPLLRAVQAAESLAGHFGLVSGVLGTIQRIIGTQALIPEHRQTLLDIRQQLSRCDRKQQKTAERLANQIDQLCDDSAISRLHADEGWADELQ